MFKELFKNTAVIESMKDLISSGDDDLPGLPGFTIDPQNYTTPNGSTFMFDSVNGDYRYFKYSGYKSFVDAYQKCPPVAAIINRKSQAFTNGRTFVLNSKGKTAEGSEAAKVKKLLSKPNAIQNWKQFEAQMYIYMHVFGFAIILPIVPFGFEGFINAKSLWNIPANWIDIPATQENFTRNGGVALTEIVVTFNGTKVVLKLSELIIIRDITVSFDTLTFPNSRLHSQDLPINNIIGAFESRNVLINFRGALGILSQDPGKGQYASVAITDPEKQALQKDFKKYGLRSKQFQVILTTASLKWQSMGYPTKDLMLMEEVEESTIAICNALNFPPFIIGLADTTYNNMTEALKGLYQDSIISDAENIYEQLTSAFDLERLNITITKDYCHLPILQKDQLAAAQARKALNDALKIEWETDQLTLDEWRVKNSEEPLPNGRGKLYRSEYMKKYGSTEQTESGTGEGSTEPEEEVAQAA